MKQIIAGLITLLSFSVISQADFEIGISQNIGHVLSKNDEYNQKVGRYYISNQNIIVGTRIKVDDDWWFNVRLDIAVLKDTAIVSNGELNSMPETELYQEYSGDNLIMNHPIHIQAAETYNRSFSVSMNRRVSKVFSIGIGLQVDQRTSIFKGYDLELNYQWNSPESRYEINNVTNINELNNTVNSFHFYTPFIANFYIPVKKKELQFSNRFVIGNTGLYYQFGLSFLI